VFVEPGVVSLSYAGGPHAIVSGPVDPGSPARLRDGGNAGRKYPANRWEAENGGDISFYHPRLTLFGHSTLRGQFCCMSSRDGNHFLGRTAWFVHRSIRPPSPPQHGASARDANLFLPQDLPGLTIGQRVALLSGGAR
jgi:hypothetical protein